MPRRNFVLATGETYHIYNRSISKESIFYSIRHLSKVKETIDYYRFSQRLRLSKFKALPVALKKEYYEAFIIKPPIVEIYAFAIMPNHYHFLLKQNQDKGIVTFISNFQNSYAKFYNLKNDRSGGLFQKPFKGKRIEDDEQFIHVSRYIHLNPVTSYLIEFDELRNYSWTSFNNYRHDIKSFVNTETILSNFKNKEEYQKFISNQVDYQRTLALMKDLILE